MNDYSDRLAVDVVTAPLAEIDRRTLSQAWYSALNLAREGGSSTPVAMVRSTALSDVAPRAVGAGAGDVGHSAAPVSDARGFGDGDAGGGSPVGGAERRRLPSGLARRIDGVLARARVPQWRTTLTLHGGRGRVELLVRSTGAGVHVIAVCAPDARARVAQALAHARFALARRGIGLQASARGSQR